MICNLTLHTPYNAAMHSADCCVTGCQVCPDSDFVGSCNDCDVDGCQLTCESCRDSDGNFAAPAPFTIPAGGCVIQNSNTQLKCMPYTVGECPSGSKTQLIPVTAGILASKWYLDPNICCATYAVPHMLCLACQQYVSALRA